MPTASRKAGLARLDDFLPRAGAHYERRRNFDLGPGDRDNVSRLSPWLRRRLLLEEEALGPVLRRHGPDGASRFVEEVFWRAYFRGWMAHHPGCWTRYREALASDRERVSGNGSVADRLQAATGGETGIGAFDHWARELVTEGYLHNHARMWFASIWIFTLRLPWTLGADFFLRHLVDGDPASNTLGWRWVAGLHTRGKTYLARRDNVLKYTEGRLDPGPGLAREAPALEEDHPPPRARLSLPPQAEAVVPGARAGWIVTDEDCRAEGVSLDLDGPALGLVSVDGVSPDGVAGPVRTFARDAVIDALARLGRSDSQVLHRRADGSGVAPILDWVARHELRILHVHHAPYGPAADWLTDLEQPLAAEGVELRRHLRLWDRLTWPHADRGYFRLRKRIPAMLDHLKLTPVANA